MAAIVISSFGGVSPKTPPRYLQNSQAQVAINCPVFSGSLVPLPNVGTTITTITKTGSPTTIYRYGQEIDEDTRYWFSWNYEVDVCRGQISGDTAEWTFYTDGDQPKATYNEIALTGTALPYSSIPLGVPTPGGTDKKPLSTTVPTFAPDVYPAELTLDPIALANLTSSGLEISLDNGTTWTLVALNVSYTPSGGTAIPTLPATNRAVYVAGRINAVLSASVTTEVKLNSVIITTIAEGENVTLNFRGILAVGTSYDETGTFTYTAGFDLQGTGDQFDQPIQFITSQRWKSIGVDSQVRIFATPPNSNTLVKVFDELAPSVFASASDLADWINDNLPTISGGFTPIFATSYGSSLAIEPYEYGVTSNTIIGKLQFVIGPADTPEESTKNPISASRDLAGAARIFLTKAQLDTYIAGKFSAYILNNDSEIKTEVSENSTLFLNLPGTNTVEITDDRSAVMITTVDRGDSVDIRLRAGVYPTTSANTYFSLSAQGYEDKTSVPETRVYTYTFVSKVSNFEFESGPAAPSEAVDVYKDQPVTLSGFDLASNYPDYAITSKRIYRTVNGVYLFVAEIPITQSSYIDELLADDLSEEMSVAGWAPPPNTLQGLINLPNGNMAGFVGRDVYFCDPYHPHAWPEAYVQTVDYPIVGLGRMDTTVAVLTKGVPYFMQGSHPDSVVVVKSDIQQACASKRSIVSISGTVIYASPDGLVMLSSGGSKILTENIFTRAQWQDIAPSTIHAYQHDSKYIAFYTTGTISSPVQGGFIYDLLSGQFIFHDRYATAGYNDLMRDQLFLAFSDRTIKKWLDGSSLTYVWRSKIFTMPQIMGFSLAQVEAETYPVTAKFYCDDAVTPFYTYSVPDRDMFRLPVKEGRDFEVQLEGTAQVFSVKLAQASGEIAGA